MHKVPFGVLRRGLAVAAVAASVSLGVAACNDTTSIDPQRDRIPPTISLTPIAGRPDTVIAFSTEAKDNLGLKTIHVQAIGAVGFVDNAGHDCNSRQCNAGNADDHAIPA